MFSTVNQKWQFRKATFPHSKYTIFAKNYGAGAVISHNLKGVAPPVPAVQCWADTNVMSGCETPTLKRVGRGGGGWGERVEKWIRKWYITTECM